MHQQKAHKEKRPEAKLPLEVYANVVNYSHIPQVS